MVTIIFDHHFRISWSMDVWVEGLKAFKASQSMLQPFDDAWSTHYQSRVHLQELKLNKIHSKKTRATTLYRPLYRIRATISMSTYLALDHSSLLVSLLVPMYHLSSDKITLLCFRIFFFNKGSAVNNIIAAPFSNCD